MRAELARLRRSNAPKRSLTDILVNNASAISVTDTERTPMKRYDLMNGGNARGIYPCMPPPPCGRGPR